MTTLHHNLEDHNQHSDRRENIKSHKDGSGLLLQW
jgi:hypothetical protein